MRSGQRGIVVTCSPELVVEARTIALARHLSNANRKAHQDLGSVSANRSADHFGALAELAVIRFLEGQGVAVSGYTLVAAHAVKGADFLIGNQSFDVKASPPGKHYLSTNYEQFCDAKRAVSFYVPALFTSPTELVLAAPVPHDEAGKWDFRQGHSQYLSVHRDVLNRVDNIEAWLQVIARTANHEDWESRR